MPGKGTGTAQGPCQRMGHQGRAGTSHWRRLGSRREVSPDGQDARERWAAANNGTRTFRRKISLALVCKGLWCGPVGCTPRTGVEATEPEAERKQERFQKQNPNHFQACGRAEASQGPASGPSRPGCKALLVLTLVKLLKCPGSQFPE